MILFGILFLIILSYSVNADWHSSTFGGSVTVEESATHTYHNVSFGASVTVETSGINNMTFSSINPTNESTVSTLNPQLSLSISNSQGNNMDVYFYTNASGTWQLVNDSNNPYIGFGGQSFSVNTENMTSYTTTYYWNVSVKDRTTSLWRNETYHFTTVNNQTPIINTTTILPVNNSENQTLQLSLSAYIYDNESDQMTWTIECSNGDSDSGSTYNDTISLSLSELEENTTYQWWVNVSDAYSSTNETFFFTTNYIEITAVSPAPDSTDVSLTPTLKMTPLADGDNIDIEFRSVVSGTWKTLQTFFNAADDIERQTTNTSHMDTQDTTYTWSVNITDNTTRSYWTNKTFTFTTLTEQTFTWHNASFGATVEVTDGNPSPILTNETPTDTATDISTSLSQVSVNISDNEHDFNFTIQGAFLSNVFGNNQANGTKSASVSGSLSYSTEYTWYVNSTDGNTWTNATYTFTTQSEPNVTFVSTSFGGSVTVESSAPTINSVSPANESTDILMQPTLELNITEPQSQQFDTDGNYSQTATFANTSNTTYWFTVHLNDTEGNWNNETFHFTIATYQWSSSTVWKIGKTSNEDTNLDMKVDSIDLIYILDRYLSNNETADFNSDGVVNYLDRSLIQNRYGENYE